MDKQEVIQKTADMIRDKFLGEGSGHDWWHIYRVWQTSKTILKSEEADGFIVELGALLHDVADYKLHGGDEEIGGKVTREWLESLEVEAEITDQVVHIVDNISFKGGTGKNKINTIEGKIVQDADRLDAMGAIGAARCFIYGGHSGQEMYDPDKKPRMNMTKEEYKKTNGTMINHFYEKLLLLKNLMNTQTGKKLAQKRHEFMETFLEEFYKEWEGER